MEFLLSPDDFLVAAEPILRLKLSCLEGIANQRRWMACFGAKPDVMADLWTRIDPSTTMPEGAKPEHMTWVFYFLKLYNTEDVNTRNVGGCDEKTFRKWVWLFVDAISYQEYPIISWEKRFMGNFGNEALITIDGTDVPVQHKFDPKLCSHKFKSNGLKYEVGVCIQTGNIVWINGPFRAGVHDITISRQAVIGALNEGEMIKADGGYEGEPFYIKIPDDCTSSEQRYMKTVTRSHHETANKRFKIFEVLERLFRHPFNKHSSCFRAVAVITQLNIEYGHPLYSVEYFDEVKTNSTTA
eukprot:CCRYP_010417-RA/>CCRYP_010417-RA protein AED:0.07 eAED:0.04 QI:0/0/0/1/1/1/2/0/297